MSDESLPDIYADGLSVSAGPTGLTITWLLSEPTIMGNPDPPKAVGRVRMSLELGDALVTFVEGSIKNARQLPIAKFSLPSAGNGEAKA